MTREGADEVAIAGRSECDPRRTIVRHGDGIGAIARIGSSFCHFCYVVSSACKVENKNVSDYKSFGRSPIGVDGRIGRDSPTQGVANGISGSGGAPTESSGNEKEENRRPISHDYLVLFSDRPFD